MTDQTQGFEAIAIRMTNAENDFVEAVKEQFSFSEAEAEKILKVFKNEKIVKIDAVLGSFSLSQGIFWNKEVMENALTF